jgi:hypothetical protein
VQPSPARKKVLFPGSVVTEPGDYLIIHSTGHHPNASIYLIRGLHLPACGVKNCMVSFELLGASMGRSHRGEKAS